jgi:hypothetical protein
MRKEIVKMSTSKRDELVPKTIILTRDFNHSDISTMCSGRGRSHGTSTLSSCLCGGNISDSSDDSSDDYSDVDGTNLAEKLKLMKEKAQKRKRNLKVLRWRLSETKKANMITTKTVKEMQHCN